MERVINRRKRGGASYMKTSTSLTQEKLGYFIVERIHIHKAEHTCL